ncbi:MAG: hypothetical protein ACTSP6_07565 [Promethearchaeota archaeon]
MNSQSFMNKRKLIVNNIVGVALISVIFAQLMFFRLIAILSIVVYPMSVALPYGIYRVYKTVNDRETALRAKIIKVIFQIAYVIFSMLFLNMIFSYPHITLSYIIYFLAIPTSLIGLAGFLKGSMIGVYSPSFRFLNVLIGLFTIFYTFIAIVFADFNFTLHLIVLLGTLTVNGILRAALYLSEYGLSLNKMKSFKIVLYIMDTHLTIRNIEEDQF